MRGSSDFYVYEHIRPGTGAAFYVGKGRGGRSEVRQHRNPWWRAIVAKTGGYTTRVVADQLDEELAFLIERERINQLRTMGITLSNLTDGGEGMSGYKFPADVIERRSAAQRGQKRPSVSAALKGRPKTAAHRLALAAAKLGKKPSAAARAKMSATRKGRPSSMLGKKHRPESKDKISRANRGERNRFFGRTHTAESRAKMSAALTGVKLSAETRSKMSLSRQGPLNPRFGLTIPEEQKARQIATLKRRPRLVCPHCGTEANDGNARRWHFDNCRKRT